MAQTARFENKTKFDQICSPQVFRLSLSFYIIPVLLQYSPYNNITPMAPRGIKSTLDRILDTVIGPLDDEVAPVVSKNARARKEKQHVYLSAFKAIILTR